MELSAKIRESSTRVYSTIFLGSINRTMRLGSVIVVGWPASQPVPDRAQQRDRSRRGKDNNGAVVEYTKLKLFKI